jgi:hypothetical protein
MIMKVFEGRFSAYCTDDHLGLQKNYTHSGLKSGMELSRLPAVRGNSPLYSDGTSIAISNGMRRPLNEQA